jgi:hypothetical protein
MKRWFSFRLDSIRQRLRIGFGVLIVLLSTGGVLGYTALSNMSSVIRGTLVEVQEEGLLSARLSAAVMRELSAASAYLESRDSLARAEFQRLSWETHRVQREMNKRPGQIAQEVTLIAEHRREALGDRDQVRDGASTLGPRPRRGGPDVRRAAPASS